MATNIEKYTKQVLVGITGQCNHINMKKKVRRILSEILIESIKFMSPQNKDKMIYF